MDEQCIAQPLLLATAAAAASILAITNYPPLNNDEDAKDTSAPSPDSSIIYHLSSIFFVGLLSVWENLEASKGFKLTVANDAASSPARKRFTQIYVSDDKATREVHHASNFVETLLYNNIRSDPTTIKKKPIKHVIIWLARQNLTRTETIKATGDHKFVMNLSPSLMEAKDVKYEVASAIHHGIRGEHGPRVEFGA